MTEENKDAIEQAKAYCRECMKFNDEPWKHCTADCKIRETLNKES